MHTHSIEPWLHSHDFSVDQKQAEKKTKIVMLLTAVTMVAEIVAGSIFGSMALLADGWHMATHVGAFGITVFAYRYARHHVSNPTYTFGTGKVSVLGGFASAIALAVVAFIMAFESAGRLFQPHLIQFNEAIGIALLGLVVNLVSALLLQDHHGHDHGHSHGHNHGPDHEYPPEPGHVHSPHGSHHHDDRDDYDHHHDEHTHHGPAPVTHSDPNLRAAYVHVLADALTSVLAIAALVAGKFVGWIWMDAVMGLVGAAVITKWSYGLIRDTGVVLLDGGVQKQTKLAIVSAIEDDADNRVTDLHVWHVGQHHLAATVALVTHEPKTPSYYKTLLTHIPSLSHVIVEVNQCQGDACRELPFNPLR